MAKKGAAGSEERRTYWQTAIELHRESGISVRRFCRQEGLSEPSFYAWRRQLSNGETAATEAEPRPTFVPVEIKPTSHQRTSSSSLVIELTGGTRLHVGEGCSPQLLKATLELLGC